MQALAGTPAHGRRRVRYDDRQGISSILHHISCVFLCMVRSQLHCNPDSPSLNHAIMPILTLKSCLCYGVLSLPADCT